MRLTLVVSLALTLTPIASFAYSDKTPVEAYQETIQKLNVEYEKLRKKIAELENDANRIKALIDKYEAALGTTTLEKTAKLTNAISVSEDGNVHIQNLEATAIKTKEAVKVEKKSFKVAGDLDKFYPIVFQQDRYTDWGESPVELEIFRADLHTDSYRRGSLMSRFTIHTSFWGHGSDFIDAEIHQSGNFIAGYANFYYGTQSVIWLRGGGTTYYWRGNVSLVDFKAEVKELTTGYPKGHKLHYPTKYEVKTEAEIAPHLKKKHIYPWDKQIERLENLIPDNNQK